MLDHDFGHLCFGRRIQISGHSDIVFKITMVHLPCGLECELIPRQLLLLRNQAVWR